MVPGATEMRRASCRFAAFVERQERRFLSSQLGAYVDLVQVNGKMRESTCFAVEQSRRTVTVLLVLAYRLAIIPAGPGRIAFQLDGEKRQAVQEDDEIDALVLLVPNLLHHRKVVLLEEPDGVGVEYGRRLRVHEIERRHAVKVDAVPQDADKSTPSDIGGDAVEDTLLDVAIEEVPQLLERLGLRVLDERHEHARVYRALGIKLKVAALDIAVHLQPVIYELLEVFLGKRVLYGHGHILNNAALAGDVFVDEGLTLGA